MDKNVISSEERMMERGKFEANGYEFVVRPIYLMEEDEFLSDVKISPVPRNENGEEKKDITEKELGHWSIMLFSKTVNGETKKRKRGIISRFLFWLIHRNDYHYYENASLIQPFIKWIERKVTYKGRKIRFYDLERKFWLSKSDIERLFIYLYEISGF